MAEDQPPRTPKSPHVDSNMMGHPVFGDLEEKFPQYRLPTFLQVLNRVRCLKSLQGNRLDSNRTIYNIVASELSLIWKEAFVVPILDLVPLATRIGRDIEKKMLYVRSNLSKIVDPNHPEKLTAQLSEMKQVFSITKCRCFLNKEHRQDVIRSNCKCANPIVNLETYGDQLFGFDEICIFEDDKVTFTQMIAEMPTPPPTPSKTRPSSAESGGDYGKTFLANKRARKISYDPPTSFEFPSDPEDVEMEVPDQGEVNWDPVLETMLSKGVKPFAIMQIISKFPIIY